MDFVTYGAKCLNLWTYYKIYVFFYCFKGTIRGWECYGHFKVSFLKKNVYYLYHNYIILYYKYSFICIIFVLFTFVFYVYFYELIPIELYYCHPPVVTHIQLVTGKGNGWEQTSF